MVSKAHFFWFYFPPPSCAVMVTLEVEAFLALGCIGGASVSVEALTPLSQFTLKAPGHIWNCTKAFYRPFPHQELASRALAEDPNVHSEVNTCFLSGWVSLESQWCAQECQCCVPPGCGCFDGVPQDSIWDPESYWTVDFLVKVLLWHGSSASWQFNY